MAPLQATVSERLGLKTH